ncbi:hypothetical protein LIA77_07281 [Sarocladium implicatum]|nr:hypothetical protein LIA77_07281 [Sarocladium implicatum]
MLQGQQGITIDYLRTDNDHCHCGRRSLWAVQCSDPWDLDIAQEPAQSHGKAAETTRRPCTSSPSELLAVFTFLSRHLSYRIICKYRLAGSCALDWTPWQNRVTTLSAHRVLRARGQPASVTDVTTPLVN